MLCPKKGLIKRLYTIIINYMSQQEIILVEFIFTN